MFIGVGGLEALVLMLFLVCDGCFAGVVDMLFGV